MTDEQRQRIWEIENSCDGRTELAERIVGLEDKLAIYENDHQIALRTYGSWKRLKAEVPTLREENSKLREVLESVLKCAGEIKRDSGCDTCPMYNQDGSFADGSWCRLRPELRNLGFEVETMQRRRG
jgi:hypothetical protein